MTDQDDDVKQGGEEQTPPPPGFEPEPDPDSSNDEQEEGNNSNEDGGEDEEIEAIKQKAAYWQLIEEDPELFQMVEAHFRAKITGQTSPQPQVSNDDNVTDRSKKKIPAELEPVLQENQQLKELVGALQQQVAAIQVAQFQQSHPDMDLYRAEMGRLMQEVPGLSLERAYQLAKASKPGGKEGGKTPTTEIPRSSPREDAKEKQKALSKVSLDLLDRKKYPTTEQAFLAAVKKAEELEVSEEE